MSEILENEKINELFEKMKEAWNAPFVKRQDIGKFSFGLLQGNTLQTLDSRKKGIKNMLKINGHVCYLVDDVIEFLRSRIEKKEARKNKKPHKNDILL